MLRNFTNPKGAVTFVCYVQIQSW